MQTDQPRLAAAIALRALNHAFVAHDPDDEQLIAIADATKALVARCERAPRRDRLALMRAASSGGSVPIGTSGSGFADRAVGGADNPTGVDIEIVQMAEEIVALVMLRRAFEGAPGRAHGGIVAAAFDDVTGYVIGHLREPAFTGELTVRYLAPVPVDETLEMRAHLERRERRKLFITAELRHGEQVVATCRAVYITVDPAKYDGFPDPR